MKYLNSTNLYFAASDLGAALNTQTNYTLQVVNNATSPATIVRTYSGAIFYYSGTQRIYYDFLLRNIDGAVDLATSDILAKCDIQLYDETDTMVAHELVCMVERTFGMSDGLSDATYNPTTNEIGIAFPNTVEMPRVANGMVYPLILFTTPMTYTADVQVLKANDTTYDIVDLYNDMDINVALLCGVGGLEIGVVGIPHDLYFNLHAADCSANYILLWYDHRGFWQSQPFWGAETTNNDHQTITDTNNVTRLYETQVVRRWELTSDYVHKQNTYESLFVSQKIFLYNADTDEYIKVNVTDSDFRYTRDRVPFKFNINLQYDTNYYSK